MAATRRVKRVIKKNKAAEVNTFGDALNEFVMEKEGANKAPKTIQNYKQSVNYFMEFFDYTEETELKEVTVSNFFEWANTLKLDGVRHTSINHYLRDCRVFFYWCMDKNYIEEPFNITLVEGQEEPPKLFSDEDIETLLVKPNKRDSFVQWRTWATVNWVLATGNRGATICEVQLDDVNFTKKEITLRHTKNKKAQIVPLSSSLETVLREYIKMWRHEAPVGGYLFPNVGEEQLTTNALRHAFAKYCHDRDVNQTNIHGLRHNFARAWVQNNGNMFSLQKILGHATLDMTRKYVKLFSEDIKTDYDKFAALDNIKRNAKRTQVVKRNR